jgi:hypothetical protein
MQMERQTFAMPADEQAKVRDFMARCSALKEVKPPSGAHIFRYE